MGRAIPGSPIGFRPRVHVGFTAFGRSVAVRQAWHTGRRSRTRILRVKL